MQHFFEKNLKASNQIAYSLYERLKDQTLVSDNKEENQHIKLDYQILTLLFKCSRRQLTRHLRTLESSGLIKRYSIPSEIINGKVHNNVMYIEIVEETPNKQVI